MFFQNLSETSWQFDKGAVRVLTEVADLASKFDRSNYLSFRDITFFVICRKFEAPEVRYTLAFIFFWQTVQILGQISGEEYRKILLKGLFYQFIRVVIFSGAKYLFL